MVRTKGLNDWFQSGSYPWTSKSEQTAISGLILTLQKLVSESQGKKLEIQKYGLYGETHLQELGCELIFYRKEPIHLNTATGKI